ncbi:MAG: hypothetical protein MJ089_05860 [Ruminococcus sp.]|nr:hypothetical protein [Ruminococcus sp.]
MKKTVKTVKAITAMALAAIAISSVGVFGASAYTNSNQTQPTNQIVSQINGKSAQVKIPAIVNGDYNFWYVYNGAQVSVSGKYNYSTHNYEFAFTGNAKSSGNLAMTYLSNGQKKTAIIPLTVDSNFNVTVGNIIYK